jgi:fimbrial chaperone protein
MYFLRLYLAIFASVVCLQTARAMSVEPLVLDVASAGAASKQSFRVGNDGATGLPVEINVARIEIDPNGKLHYQSAEDDFLIYPPQANIPKGGAQTFRVQWIGNPDIKESSNYRFTVSQVPVKQSEDTSGIQISLSFGVIVSVSPPQGNAAIAVTGAKPAKGENGKQAVALSIKNTGNKHAYMRDAAVSLSAGNWSQKLTAYEVGQKVGLGIVQPGKERRFLIPVDVPPGVSDITASIDYQPEK